MRAIMVMFDSLSKRMLPIYGDDMTQAPNFKRLAEKTTVFHNFYAGSMPCMPARRELHTGRYNFLHRSWGPLEPFDDSMPEILKSNGIYTHLVSDHLHYWGDGGATYHTRYSSWDCVRGQVADAWVPKVGYPEIPEHLPTMREFTHPNWWRNYWKNRDKIISEQDFPQTRTFNGGMEFLELNKDEDNWFLQIETFDPHEPFDVADEFSDLYGDDYDGPFFNSPPYGARNEEMETDEVVEHAQKLYRQLTTQCDYNLGRVLDFMDEHGMWDDTMLIINTDHGLLVGERDWWAKSVMPCYNELVNTPFCIWDPRVGKTGDRQALAQTIDIAPTLLDFFGLDVPDDMQGKPLKPVIESDETIHEAGLFGYTGGFVNITTGETTYMRASHTLGNTPVNEYTFMTMERSGFMKLADLRKTEMTEPFTFTKGCPVMKIPFANKAKAPIFCNSFQYGNRLWDLKEDPSQLSPVDDPQREAQMINLLIEQMKLSDAPLEQYGRLGLDESKVYEAADVAEMKQKRDEALAAVIPDVDWSDDALVLFAALAGLMDDAQMRMATEVISSRLAASGEQAVTFGMVKAMIVEDFKVNPTAASYLTAKMMRVQ